MDPLYNTEATNHVYFPPLPTPQIWYPPTQNVTTNTQDVYNNTPNFGLSALPNLLSLYPNFFLQNFGLPLTNPVQPNSYTFENLGYNEPFTMAQQNMYPPVQQTNAPVVVNGLINQNTTFNLLPADQNLLNPINMAAALHLMNTPATTVEKPKDPPRKRRKQEGYSKCEICPRKILTVEIVQHRMDCFQSRKFGCIYCSKRFIRRCGLKQHAFTHSEDYYIKCVYCMETISHTADIAKRCFTCNNKIQNQLALLRYREELSSSSDSPIDVVTIDDETVPTSTEFNQNTEYPQLELLNIKREVEEIEQQRHH